MLVGDRCFHGQRFSAVLSAVLSASETASFRRPLFLLRDMHAFNRPSIYECLENVWEIIVDWYRIPDGSQLLVAVRRAAIFFPKCNAHRRRQLTTGRDSRDPAQRICIPHLAAGGVPRRCISISFYLFIHINFPGWSDDCLRWNERRGPGGVGEEWAGTFSLRERAAHLITHSWLSYCS